MGGKAVYLDCTDDENFNFNIDGLSKNVSKKTKWLILNSPSNPTGKILTHNELEKIGKILKENLQVNVLCDNIYENTKSESRNSPNLINIYPELKDRVVMVSGVSKAYNMTGWRIGFGAGPKQLISHMGKLQSQTTTNACSISQHAAIAALKHGDSFVNQNKVVYKRKYDLMSHLLNSINGVACRVPEGGLAIFANCRELLTELKNNSTTIRDDIDLSIYLVEKAGVAVVPGSAFGMEGFLRISCGQNEKILEWACNNIKFALTNITP